MTLTLSSTACTYLLSYFVIATLMFCYCLRGTGGGGDRLALFGFLLWLFVAAFWPITLPFGIYMKVSDYNRKHRR